MSGNVVGLKSACFGEDFPGETEDAEPVLDFRLRVLFGKLGCLADLFERALSLLAVFPRPDF